MSRIRWTLALAALLSLRSLAFGAGVGWDIDDYQVEITLRDDGALEIVETITVDFTREAHRGIFREIPFSYERDGSRFRLRMAIDGVTNGAGVARPYTSWREDGRLHIRVGDPDVFLDGVQVYRIAYTVRRGLLRFETHDEIYWNAIGTEWPVPIEGASCVVRLPDSIDASSARTASFVGPLGSTGQGPPGQDIGGNALRFEMARGAPMRTGLTIVVSVPPDVIPEPSTTTRIGWFLADNGVLAAPLIVFGLLLALWWTRGRDRGFAGPIVVQYESPDGLTPAEAGTLIDERAETRDITATVVDLAIRGYLTIDATANLGGGDPDPEDVRLLRSGTDDADLAPFERRILDELFRKGEEITLDDLRFEFYSELSKIRSSIYDALSRRGYTTVNLGTARGAWMAIGFVAAGLIILGAVVLQKRGAFTPVPLFVAAVLCAIQMPIFAYAMPRKTAKGRRALEQVQGLEEYIRRAAVEELDAKARVAQFERLLPFAMAFGLSTRWAKAFEGIYDHAPEWYRTPHTSAWTTAWMVRSLSRSTATMGASMAAAPRSSAGGSSFGGGGSGFSGGFSGGGGGGGGGGAW